MNYRYLLHLLSEMIKCVKSVETPLVCAYVEQDIVLYNIYRRFKRTIGVVADLYSIAALPCSI